MTNNECVHPFHVLMQSVLAKWSDTTDSFESGDVSRRLVLGVMGSNGLVKEGVLAIYVRYL